MKRRPKRNMDPVLAEAKRLAALPARERKAALAVHERIADDDRLSQVTRDHARYVADTLARHIKRIRE